MVFITRNLKSDSPLLHWSREKGVEVVGRSLLRFEAVPFEAPRQADWWFFYSSRAVQFSGTYSRNGKKGRDWKRNGKRLAATLLVGRLLRRRFPGRSGC